MKRLLVMLLLVATVLYAFGKVTFGSTQLTPAAEREFMIRTLAEFSKTSGIAVEFLNFEYADLLSRVEAEDRAGKVSLNLVGDLQSGLVNLAAQGLLMDLSNVEFVGRTFLKSLEDYSYYNNQKIFIPWMQATYVFAINKKAFDYLPSGLTKEDVLNGTEKWTYEALLEWAKNLQTATRMPQLGFPLGPRGLWHRFLHGYIYPSYTGYQVKEFDSQKALPMWSFMKELFNYVHPAATTWDSMDQPLLRNEVMIAWDHTARLKSAIVERPNDFVIAPSPRGPAGRGYIVVLAGLAIPRKADPELPIKVIEFLTSPQTQLAVLENVGFFPVVKEAEGVIPEGALRILAEGVIKQADAPDSIVAFIPSLGAKGGEFNETYRDAFTRIVFNKEDPSRVIKELGTKLKKIFADLNIELP
ncbi:ABC transporter substrate-binding protein [Pseudothermotoga thermarum]|uniref:Carbohydrate ABC transporter substrate-binding protein, CUT1 family n=1 Tax=Pseudothermotoga thermarum DSM 5069 TaxID=688269 RepID=F7YVL5_9THEM|nr:ABC transporter substrate-binding protein [Pseudothermotoga thermarum]AEH51673.1 carbohydrate ABC transporter substrate-binding protein, CUT1 family [Pseudothermotoga thermarum DSM 5069]